MAFLKHRATVEVPNLSLAPNGPIKSIIDQFFRLYRGVSKNIYDDLVGLTPGRSDALPVASIDYLGKFYIKINSGAADTLHFCIFNGATLVYEWKAITLT